MTGLIFTATMLLPDQKMNLDGNPGGSSLVEENLAK